MASLVVAIYTDRAQGITQEAVVAKIEISNVPQQVRGNARAITEMVYQLPEGLADEELGAMIFGACMKKITGLQRQA